jgi:PAS domain S-box-containing protein
LFAAVIGSAWLLASARSTTEQAVSDIRLVDATESALSDELSARDLFERRPSNDAAAAQTAAQQRVVVMLRQLGTTPHSAAAHEVIADETAPLHDAAAGVMGQPTRLIPVRRSLDRASKAVLDQATRDLAAVDAIQMGVYVAGPIIFALGLSGIAWLLRLTFLAQARREKRVEDNAAAVCFYERRFRSLIHNATDMVLLCDASGRVIYQSPSAETGWGHPPGGLLSHPVLALTHPDERNAILELGIGKRSMALEGATTSTIDARLLDGSGQWRDAELTVSNLLANPDMQAIVIVARDIGPRKSRERALEAQTLYDPLTGLPNLILLQDRLEQALVRGRRRKRPVGLMLARIQPLGQPFDAAVLETAEAILETVGRLRLCIRTSDTVARLHDGTLAVVLDELDDEAAARVIADRITAECNRFTHRDLPGSPSPLAIGIALAEPASATVTTLMQEATLALARARPGEWVLFEPDMQERALDWIELASDLRVADMRREMHMTYQPVVRMADQVLLGFEAAVRWEHPSLGAIDAARFGSLANETGLAVPIGRWMLEECCRQVADWQKQSRLMPPLSVFVKLAARQFQSPSIEADVVHALETAGMIPECLTLEITEAALLHDFEAAVGVLWALRHRGVRIAIDGLGSGYSALPILQRLPIDALKLNARRLTGDMSPDGMDTACPMAAMAASLNMEVAAEGIETAEQSEMLRSWGCEFGQGGLYQAPLDATAAEAMVRSATRSRTLEHAKSATAPLRRPSPGRAPGGRPGPEWPDASGAGAFSRPDRPRPGLPPRNPAAPQQPATVEEA